MQKIMIAGVALAIGLIIGFFVASRLDRAELERLRTENEASKKRTTENAPEQTALTENEIAEKLGEAERRKEDFQFQKSLGMALYRYAAIKQDADLLSKVQPVIVRAAELGPNDADVLNTAGNLFFDLAYAKRDPAGYQKARGFYERALAKRPDDPNVLTDLGLTYLLDEPPDYSQAAAKMQKAAELNPQDIRALQFGTQALIRLGRMDDARKNLQLLRSADPNNSSIKELSSMIEAAAGQKTR